MLMNCLSISKSNSLSVLLISALVGMFSPMNSSSENCPCDIYKAGGTPCIAAHSTVRSLYAAYSGKLYQVRRQSDNKTLDIGVLTPGGYANTAAVDSFCSGTKCDLMAIYDQSGKGNDLWVQGSTQVPASTSSKPSNIKGEENGAGLLVGGHKAYSVFIEQGNSYWHDASKSGIAIKDQPEGMYMVTNSTHYNNQCCFDYGNSETNRNPVGAGAMDALNFSSIPTWGTGAGNGPWIMADLEWGIFAQNSTAKNSNDPSQTSKYVTAVLKNDGKSEFALRGGKAASGSLSTYYKGALPKGWTPMVKEGAIVLGSGGDCCKPGGGANLSIGTFYEGAIVYGYPSDTTENAIQANIVSSGYGSSKVSVANVIGNQMRPPCNVTVHFSPLKGSAVISYTLERAQQVKMSIFDQRGKQISGLINEVVSPGSHKAVWDAKGTPAGVYVCTMLIDGKNKWAGKIVIGK
jgi:non-reducing end alpha-L-arabinofuranosidase